MKLIRSICLLALISTAMIVCVHSKTSEETPIYETPVITKHDNPIRRNFNPRIDLLNAPSIEKRRIQNGRLLKQSLRSEIAREFSVKSLSQWLAFLENQNLDQVTGNEISEDIQQLKAFAKNLQSEIIGKSNEIINNINMMDLKLKEETLIDQSVDEIKKHPGNISSNLGANLAWKERLDEIVNNAASIHTEFDSNIHGMCAVIRRINSFINSMKLAHINPRHIRQPAPETQYYPQDQTVLESRPDFPTLGPKVGHFQARSHAAEKSHKVAAQEHNLIGNVKKSLVPAIHKIVKNKVHQEMAASKANPHSEAGEALEKIYKEEEDFEHINRDQAAVKTNHIMNHAAKQVSKNVAKKVKKRLINVPNHIACALRYMEKLLDKLHHNKKLTRHEKVLMCKARGIVSKYIAKKLLDAVSNESKKIQPVAGAKGAQAAQHLSQQTAKMALESLNKEAALKQAKKILSKAEQTQIDHHSSYPKDLSVSKNLSVHTPKVPTNKIIKTINQAVQNQIVRKTPFFEPKQNQPKEVNDKKAQLNAVHNIQHLVQNIDTQALKQSLIKSGGDKNLAQRASDSVAKKIASTVGSVVTPQNAKYVAAFIASKVANKVDPNHKKKVAAKTASKLIKTLIPASPKDVADVKALARKAVNKTKKLNKTKTTLAKVAVRIAQKIMDKATPENAPRIAASIAAKIAPKVSPHHAAKLAGIVAKKLVPVLLNHDNKLISQAEKLIAKKDANIAKTTAVNNVATHDAIRIAKGVANKVTPDNVSTIATKIAEKVANKISPKLSNDISAAILKKLIPVLLKKDQKKASNKKINKLSTKIAIKIAKKLAKKINKKNAPRIAALIAGKVAAKIDPKHKKALAVAIADKIVPLISKGKGSSKASIKKSEDIALKAATKENGILSPKTSKKVSKAAKNITKTVEAGKDHQTPEFMGKAKKAKAASKVSKAKIANAVNKLEEPNKEVKKTKKSSEQAKENAKKDLKPNNKITSSQEGSETKKAKVGKKAKTHVKKAKKTADKTEDKTSASKTEDKKSGSKAKKTADKAEGKKSTSKTKKTADKTKDKKSTSKAKKHTKDASTVTKSSEDESS